MLWPAGLGAVPVGQDDHPDPTINQSGRPDRLAAARGAVRRRYGASGSGLASAAGRDERCELRRDGVADPAEKAVDDHVAERTPRFGPQ